MAAPIQNSLTRVVKRFLDVFRVFAYIALIVWPLAVIAMTTGQSSHPETWGVDIGFFSGFSIDFSAFAEDLPESPGVRDPVMSGKAVLNIDTSSLRALYVFTLLTEIGVLVGLYVLLQLRRIFASLVKGEYFATDNSRCIRNIGIVVTCWSLLSPLLQYFGGQVILSEYALNVPGVQLSPAFELNGLGIFIGLAMIVLSGVLNEATKIHQLQQLTI